MRGRRRRPCDILADLRQYGCAAASFTTIGRDGSSSAHARADRSRRAFPPSTRASPRSALASVAETTAAVDERSRRHALGAIAREESRGRRTRSPSARVADRAVARMASMSSRCAPLTDRARLTRRARRPRPIDREMLTFPEADALLLSYDLAEPPFSPGMVAGGAAQGAPAPPTRSKTAATFRPELAARSRCANVGVASVRTTRTPCCGGIVDRARCGVGVRVEGWDAAAALFCAGRRTTPGLSRRRRSGSDSAPRVSASAFVALYWGAAAPSADGDRAVKRLRKRHAWRKTSGARGAGSDNGGRNSTEAGEVKLSFGDLDWSEFMALMLRLGRGSRDAVEVKGSSRGRTGRLGEPAAGASRREG